MCLLGNAKTVTVGGSDSQTILANLTPGVTYEVTVVAVKGQRESEPGSDSVTTGCLRFNPHSYVFVYLPPS